MNAPKNVPLIERRADARTLEEQIKAHKQNCNDCLSLSRAHRDKCARANQMRAELDPRGDPHVVRPRPGHGEAVLMTCYRCGADADFTCEYCERPVCADHGNARQFIATCTTDCDTPLL